VTTSPQSVITGAVEGPVDEAVLRRLVIHVHATPGSVYGKSGKTSLRRSIGKYNQAARRSSWLILVDLDHDADCAPALRASWLPNPERGMCFRIVVREVEAWLLADPERFAAFLGIAISRVPRDPENIEDPKRFIVGLATHSRRRDIREDMVPRPGSGRAVGPAYTSRLIQYATDMNSGWRPDVAAGHADSLSRCLRSLRRLGVLEKEDR